MQFFIPAMFSGENARKNSARVCSRPNGDSYDVGCRTVSGEPHLKALIGPL
jgi:hypothetical protein